MIDYFEGEMIDFQNITPAVANKALEGLAQIHQLSIFHGDMYEAQCALIRNVMVSKSGEVKWIDFEHSKFGQRSWIDMEMAVALELWGPDGKVWRQYVLFDKLHRH
jgi:RIO-like serine/threonine protein kinase